MKTIIAAAIAAIALASSAPAYAYVWQLDFEQGRCVESAYTDVKDFYLLINNSGRFQLPPFLNFQIDKDDAGNWKASWISDETVEQNVSDQRRRVTWVFTPTSELCEKLREMLGIAPTGHETTAQWQGGRVTAKGWWNQ